MIDNIEICYVNINSLKLSDYNPRTWTDKQKEDLKQSITTFGIVDPILANSAEGRNGIIIGGHFRFTVLQELGETVVPVIYINVPDLEKEKELNIRLNKNQGEFDLNLLATFDDTFLSDIGFTPIELSEIFIDLDTEDDEFDVAKELETIKVPESKVGDIYQLGDHRLICGDSADPEVIKKLVGDTKMAMVYNDPPYNINLSYKTGIGGSKNYGGSTDDKKTDKEYKEFLKKTMKSALSVIGTDAHIFYYCDQKYVPTVSDLYDELGINYKRTCIWLKGVANPTPQIAFSKVYEPCVYGTVGKPYLSPHYKNFDEVLNKEVGTGNQMIDDVTELFDIWLVKRLDSQSYNHPTEKPVTLHDKPLKRCTKVGDAVLSLFGGSGGDLIACHQLKRVCYMVEQDPVFVDLIIRRYERLTGEKVTKLND
jgi:DNA modification methylase